MENIYKIKIRSNPDPSDRYPSERRYSSTIVLGFSVVFLALAMTSSLMGTLVVRNMSSEYNETTDGNITGLPTDLTVNATEEDNERFIKKIENDLLDHQQEIHHPLNMPAVVAAGTFVMSLGLVLAGISGIFAWKQWYIDNNIMWFFLSACFSVITTSISFLLVALTLLEATDIFKSISYTELKEEEKVLQISVSLRVNIMIDSGIALVWSIIATKVSFNGMNSSYPDDIVLSKRGGRIQVNTVIKGNKTDAKVLPPDILNHFPTNGKLAKFFAKSNYSGNLPKAESNREYEERVKKFLSGEGAEARAEETNK